MMIHRVRPGKVAPSLMALASRIPRRDSGFTLVELMVAVAISSIIVLTAVSCFRMVTKAISSANSLSTENGLLRSGFLLAMQDVDYWHSHADDKAPYFKGFMRQPSAMDVLATNDADDDIKENTWRRPFQPVRYVGRTDTGERDPYPNDAELVTGSAPRNLDIYNAPSPTPATFPNWQSELTDDHFKDPYNRNDYLPNPNAMLAHDPRSFNRMPALPPQVIIQAEFLPPWYGSVHRYGSRGDRRGYSRLMIGDYALVSATDTRDVVIPGESPRYQVNSPGPGPLTTSKSFEFTAAANPWTENSPTIVDIPINKNWGMYQPLLWTSLFQRLNYYGAYQYMTPGTALLWTDRKGRPPDIGTVPCPPFTYRRNGLVQPEGGNYFQYVVDSDYCFNLGTCDLAVRMGERFLAAPANGGRDARTTEALPLRATWPASADLTMKNFDRFSYKNPFVVFLGTGDFDWGNSSESANQEATWLLGAARLEERADVTRSDPAMLSTTVWVPYNYTDEESRDPIGGTAMAPVGSADPDIRTLDYTTKPTQTPVMKTSIMRYGRVAGSQDLTVTRVTIEDPVSGRKTELTCMPFGTTFRGARQHWRLYSSALAPGPFAPALGHRFRATVNPSIGDFYDPAAGPYYVP